MTIKQQGGIFGRNPTFNDVTVDNDLTVNKELTVLDTASIARKSTDGDVLTLKKDSTTVTKFGSVSGVVSYIVLDPRTSSAKGAGFLGSSADASEGIIQGVDGSGSVAGGTITLGTLANPFKELYLGGDVHVASGQGIDFSATSGTGTSELFDDYEEGTWTPTGISAGTVDTARYTKIGDVVTITLTVSGAITLTNGTIGGLPYSAITTSCPWYFADFAVGSGEIPMPTIAGTSILLRTADQVTGAVSTLSDLTGTYISITTTYHV